MDGPGGIILHELRKDSSPPWIDLKDLILYLLQALMGKDDLRGVWGESPHVGPQKAVSDATSPEPLGYHGYSHITLVSNASKAQRDNSAWTRWSLRSTK